MKINIKSIIVGLIIGVIITSSVFADIQTIQAFYNNIKISLNGTVIDLKDANGNTVEPFIYNGTTYLPVRAVAEALGMEVKFNETTNTVELETIFDTVSKITIEKTPSQKADEFDKWIKENMDKDGNVIINGKKVNVYTGLEEGEDSTKTTDTTVKKDIYSSDKIKAVQRNNKGEYDVNGQYYISIYQIEQLYENKGYRFRVDNVTETSFKLSLRKNNVIILDNIPNLQFNYIELDYYEENILPLLK